MNKRKILLFLIVIIIVGTGVVFYTREQDKALSENKYREVVENIEDSMNETKNIIAKANDFNLSLEEVKSRYQLQKLSPQTVEADEVLEDCIEEYSWYQSAVDSGFDYSEKEAQEEVDKLKESLEVAENKEEIEKYIATFSSEDQYWEYVKERNMIKGTIKKYEESLKEDFCKSNHVSEEQIDTSTKWNDYLEKEKKETVEEQDVQIDQKMIAKIEE